MMGLVVICFKSIGSLWFSAAIKKDKIVLIARRSIRNFISLSSKLYLPNINRQNDNIIIINVQISTENRFTKIELAIPAVTIVTAVCIVNIVHIVIKKKIIGNIG